MSGPDWYRWYPSKWLSGVLHLNNEQRGVYVQVINVILDLGECPSDPTYLGKLCNCRSHCAKRIVGELIAIGKLVETDGKLRQNRAESERIRSVISSETGRSMAEKRWKSKPQGNALGISESEREKEREKERKEESRDSESFLPRTTAAQHGCAAPQPNGAHVQKKRGSRLSPKWQPSDQDVAEASRIGLSPHEVRREADRFRDYWIAQPGQRGVKLDWAATWRNWCRRAENGDRPTTRKSTEWGLY